MANKVKVSVEFDDKAALKAVKSFEQGVDDFAKKATTAVQKLDNKWDVFIGNLGSRAVAAATDFVRMKLTESFQAALDFEEGLIGVAKTADLTEDQIGQLSAQVTKLTEGPVLADATTTLDLRGGLGQGLSCSEQPPVGEPGKEADSWTLKRSNPVC